MRDLVRVHGGVPGTPIKVDAVLPRREAHMVADIVSGAARSEARAWSLTYDKVSEDA